MNVATLARAWFDRHEFSNFPPSGDGSYENPTLKNENRAAQNSFRSHRSLPRETGHSPRVGPAL